VRSFRKFPVARPNGSTKKKTHRRGTEDAENESKKILCELCAFVVNNPYRTFLVAASPRCPLRSQICFAYRSLIFRILLPVCSHRRSPWRQSACQPLETEAQCDQQDAEEDGEAANQPNHCEGAGSGLQEHQDAEENRH